jgi:hypothetical protein
MDYTFFVIYIMLLIKLYVFWLQPNKHTLCCYTMRQFVILNPAADCTFGFDVILTVHRR